MDGFVAVSFWGNIVLSFWHTYLMNVYLWKNVFFNSRIHSCESPQKSCVSNLLNYYFQEMISDGMWHIVWIQHRKRITQIRIDANKPVKLHTGQIQKLFLTNGKTFIGTFTFKFHIKEWNITRYLLI